MRPPRTFCFFTACAREVLQPLLRHQTVIRLSHVNTVEANELRTLRRVCQDAAYGNYFDTGLCGGCARTLNCSGRYCRGIVYLIKHVSLDAGPLKPWPIC